MTAADIEIGGDAVTESYARDVLARSGCDAPRRLLRDGRPVESYRALSLDAACALLAPACAA